MAKPSPNREGPPKEKVTPKEEVAAEASPNQAVTVGDGKHVFKANVTQKIKRGDGGTGAPNQILSLQGGETTFENEFNQDYEEIPSSNRLPDPTPKPRPNGRGGDNDNSNQSIPIE